MRVRRSSCRQVVLITYRLFYSSSQKPSLLGEPPTMLLQTVLGIGVMPSVSAGMGTRGEALKCKWHFISYQTSRNTLLENMHCTFSCFSKSNNVFEPCRWIERTLWHWWNIGSCEILCLLSYCCFWYIWNVFLFRTQVNSPLNKSQ